jgi:Beta-lactamase enzyme family
LPVLIIPIPIMPMRRRDFLALGASTLIVPALAGSALAARARSRAATPGWAQVFEALPAAQRARVDDPEYQIQLLWLRVHRGVDGSARIVEHKHGLNTRRWFSPASVTKLPMALLMAERLSRLGLGAEARLHLERAPETGEWPQDEPLEDSFARGLARTFAVSENTPYNRWYELLGADAVHARLGELGYRDTRLVARLGSADIDANRRHVPGRILDAQGDVRAAIPQRQSSPRRPPYGPVFAGRGWRTDDGRLIEGARDFSHSNSMPLRESLGMLQALVLPETVPAARRWDIDPALRAELLRVLALRPRESTDPPYPEAQYPDGYARWFFVGDGTARYPDGLRVLGKTGMAYGYLSEVAYVQDARSGAEFLLGACIHVNADGIYNDDRYEYDEIGLPFLAALGRAVLAVERDAAERAAVERDAVEEGT